MEVQLALLISFPYIPSLLRNKSSRGYAGVRVFLESEIMAYPLGNHTSFYFFLPVVSIIH